MYDLTALSHAFSAHEPVLTANDRLRRHLQKAWAQQQLQAGLQAWETPALAPLSRWLDEQWQHLVRLGYPGSERLVASRHQRQWLWQQVIAEAPGSDNLLQPKPLAQQADAALRNLLLWQIDPATLADESHTNSQHFYRWLTAFQRRLDTRNLLTPEQAQQLLLTALRQGVLPSVPRLWLTGFDDIPPLHRQILTAATDELRDIPPVAVTEQAPVRTQAPDSESEVRAAALWSQAQLRQQPDAVIGIIVPDLGQRREQLEGIFTEVFEPAAGLPETPRYTLPFNFSAGMPLGSTPLIHSALALLGLVQERWPLNDLCSLLQSPFWSDVESETVVRAQLCEQLRRLGKFDITGSDLRFHSQRLTDRQPTPENLSLSRRLQQLDEERRRLPHTATARQWAQHLERLLSMLGWPGTRRLDSQEYQQLGLWYELLQSFAALDATGSDLTLNQALEQLAQEARQTPFQAQTPDSPIQILGALEGTGLRFSHCWVLGLHHRQWPPVPAPNPLLPLPLQRQQQMPNASAERELRYAQSLTDNYRQCARQVIFSSARSDSDDETSPSPLIRHLPETPLASLLPHDHSDYARYQQQLAHEQKLEAVHSAQGPGLETGSKAPGGSSLFKHQAACPFNAFAQLRLGARAPDAPVAGLSPAERGTMLHAALAQLWKHLGNSQTLHNTPADILRQLIADACGAALETIRQRRPRELGPVYCALEQERLQEVLARWLELEKLRPAFTVVAIEARREITFNGLALTLFIDRIDQLETGERLLIDYKTGSQLDARQWLSDRPDEPQLPLYAVTETDAVQAIAFAQLNPKALRWIGLGDLQTPLDGVQPPAESWPQQIHDWQQVLTQLAEDFRNGDARVDFKDDNARRYSDELLPLNRAPEADTVQRWLQQEGQ